MNGRQQVHLYIIKCLQNNKHHMNNAFVEYCLANDIELYIQIIPQLLKNELQVCNASFYQTDRIQLMGHLDRVKGLLFINRGLKSLYLYLSICVHL